MANNKLVNQIYYYDEDGNGKPIDPRFVVTNENDIYNIEYAYVGLVVSPLNDDYCYKITKINEETQKPQQYVKLGISKDELLETISASTNNAINKAIGEAIGDDSLQDQLDDAKEEFRELAEQTIQEEVNKLQDILNDAEEKINESREDLAYAKNVLEKLQASSGSAGVLVDENGGAIDMYTFYANISAQTVSICDRYQNAAKALIKDEVKKIDISANTVTTVREMLDGELGAAITEAVRTNPELNTVTAATQEINAALGKIASQVYSSDTATGEITSIDQVMELCNNGVPTLSSTVQQLTSGGVLSLSQITQTTNSLKQIVERQNESGGTIAATIASMINDDDTATIKLSADQIVLDGDTIAKAISSTTITVGNGSCVFNEDGSGQLANGNIIWDNQGYFSVKGTAKSMFLGYKAGKIFNQDAIFEVYHPSASLIQLTPSSHNDKAVKCIYIDRSDEMASSLLTICMKDATLAGTAKYPRYLMIILNKRIVGNLTLSIANDILLYELSTTNKANSDYVGILQIHKGDAASDVGFFIGDKLQDKLPQGAYVQDSFISKVNNENYNFVDGKEATLDGEINLYCTQ